MQLTKKINKVNIFTIVILHFLLSANVQAQTVKVINVGDFASDPIVDTKNSKVYITQHIINGQLLIIDLDKNKVIKKILVGSKPFKPILDENKQKIYVINRSSNNINSIDISNKNYSITKLNIDMPHSADAGAVLSQKFSRLYIPHNKEGKISVINTENNSLVKVLKVKNDIHGKLVLTNNETNLLLSNHNLGIISIINLDNLLNGNQ